MEAIELRIGNLIDYEGQYLPVLAIDNEREFFHTERNELIKCSITLGQYDDDGFMWTTNGRWLKRLKPIPLTEEWLIDFGFVSNSYQDRFENKAIHIECNKTRGYVELWVERMPHIKYVHQLQNLYYALTCEELQLKQ